MHLVLSKNAFLVKWGLPILMVVVMATLLVVVANGGSGSVSDEVSLGTDEITDFNPAGESVLVGPADATASTGGVLVLYTLEVGEQTTTTSTGSGGLCTITLTNNIAEPIADSAATGITANGDIKGNVVVTAEIYNPDMSGYPDFVATGGIAPMVKNAVGSVTIANFADVIVHPGKSVVFQVPIGTVTVAAGSIVNIKAEYVGGALF